MNFFFGIMFLGGMVAFLAWRANVKQKRGEKLSRIEKGAIAIVAIIGGIIAAVSGDGGGVL